MSNLPLEQVIIASILPVLFAITLHEVAHGWVAKLFGDNTAASLGRLSLNPIKHIDPIGTVALPLIMLATTSLFGASPFLFGWAKPVPVDYRNLRNPKKDMIWVAAAGPAANLLMAIFWTFVDQYAQRSVSPDFSLALSTMAQAGIVINISLFALNLIPLPPLDGGRILVGVLPPKLAWKVAQIEPYGFMILLGLLFISQQTRFDLLGTLMSPFILLAKIIVVTLTSIF